MSRDDKRGLLAGIGESVGDDDGKNWLRLDYFDRGAGVMRTERSPPLEPKAGDDHGLV